MRIIPFPGRDEIEGVATWRVELEAALNGEDDGTTADSWRELRADVRATAPPMAPDFERRLRARLAEQGARGLRQAAPADVAPKRPRGRLRGLLSGGGRLGGLPLSTAPRRAAVSVALVAAVVVAVLIAGPLRAGNRLPGEAVPRAPSASSAPSVGGPTATSRATNGALVQSAAGASGGVAGTSGGAAASAPVAGAEAGAPGRVQQRTATLSLSASASEVQTVADRVMHLATSVGGFVQSSQVQVLAPQEGTSHAELQLRLPSAKLTAALAALGQLAPVRSESQALQDITNSYDAARQRLGDATAERQALLRALARASTEGEIDSLRERLAQARRAIAAAQAAFHAVSQRASISEVEVTVLGDARATSEGLTLHRGLHDAGRVLVVTLAVLLIALAILAPLALLLLALTSALGAWRRYRRERVLDAR
jgi:Domain of unknown function (DUF4349)